MEDLRKKLVSVVSASKIPFEAINFVVQSFAREINYEYQIANLKEEAKKDTQEETPE